MGQSEFQLMEGKGPPSEHAGDGTRILVAGTREFLKAPPAIKLRVIKLTAYSATLVFFIIMKIPEQTLSSCFLGEHLFDCSNIYLLYSWSMEIYDGLASTKDDL